MSATAEADESAAAHKILAWGWVAAVTSLAGIGGGLFAAADGDSARFDLLVVWGGQWLGWFWLDAQLRPYRPRLPMDAGWFAMLAFTPTALYYLWRYERWRGIGKVGLVLAFVAAAHAASAVVRVVFSALLAARGAA